MNAIQKLILGIVSIGVFITGCALPVNMPINNGNGNGNNIYNIFNGNQSKQEEAERFQKSFFKNMNDSFGGDIKKVSGVSVDFLPIDYEKKNDGAIVSATFKNIISIDKPFVMEETFESGRYTLEYERLKNFTVNIADFLYKAQRDMKDDPDYDIDVSILGTSDGSRSNVKYSHKFFQKDLDLQIKVGNVIKVLSYRKGEVMDNLQLAGLRAFYGQKLLELAIRNGNLSSKHLNIAELSAITYQNIGREYRKLRITIEIKKHFKEEEEKR